MPIKNVTLAFLRAEFLEGLKGFSLASLYWLIRPCVQAVLFFNARWYAKRGIPTASRLFVRL